MMEEFKYLDIVKIPASLSNMTLFDLLNDPNANIIYAKGILTIDNIIDQKYAINFKINLNGLDIEDDEDIIDISQTRRLSKRQKTIRNKMIKELYEKGLTQREISDKLNISQALVSNILKEVRDMCRKYVKSTNFETLLKNSSKVNKLKDKLIGQINACKLEKEKLNNRKKRIYFDKVDKIITLDEYRDFSNQIVNETIKQDEILKELENQLNILEKKIVPNDEYQSIIKEYLKMKKPNKRLLSYIIDNYQVN